MPLCSGSFQHCQNFLDRNFPNSRAHSKAHERVQQKDFTSRSFINFRQSSSQNKGATFKIDVISNGILVSVYEVQNRGIYLI